MSAFIGREYELKRLNGLLGMRSARFVVVEGRRRIGKSRLLREFSKSVDKVYWFTGLAPEGEITAEMQRNEFANQLLKQISKKEVKHTDWSDLFWELSKRTQQGNVLIVLDEISWMGSKDPAFLGKLKNAWDLHFSKNDRLILAVSGSVSSWIDKNLLSSTGFVGRISLVLKLKELPLYDCAEFWDSLKTDIAAYEKLKVLAVTGGVPRYLEEIDPRLSAEDNIKNMCFQPEGVLFREFNNIFHDLFSKRSALYKKVVNCLSDRNLRQVDIYKKLGLANSSDLAHYLEDLDKAGFITRDYTWSLGSGKRSSLSKYRISDNYIRFYLKYIEPRKDQITRHEFETRSLSALPGWYSLMGLQFENLVLSNRARIRKIIGVSPDDIIYENPFFQMKTTRQKGCQIDYLIQTRFDTLYVCEIKFSKNLVGVEVISEVKEKIKKLKKPRSTSCRAVLIHTNGVTDDVLDTGYFVKIIDFSQLLNKG
ncbi:MAG: ATP-binding protein [Gammaproteobacteria bacterium]|jgi:AAA+ ATPase superfamily predicted ATPase